MRVTRAIREYVEEEISKKYSAVIEDVGKEYEAEKEMVKQGVLAIMKKASDEAHEYIRSCGFCHSCYSYGRYNDSGDSPMFELHGYIVKRDEEERINNEKVKLRDSRDKKTKQVLFDLEMGDTEKAQLKDVLDGITVD